tara:strand:+ start:145491 stop:146054 length:564 start_codon:yes stop_codon:yes gene_type:complete
MNKILNTLITAGALTFITSATMAETVVLREISMRTFSGSINDEKDHPVMVIDDIKKPTPIGPGRGAGGYVFLNNNLFDWKSNEPVGMLRGLCFTIDHGDDGPWKGPVVIGAGGPYDSACQLNYVMDKGQIVASGNIDLNAMERDENIPLAIIGGTGDYKGARGEARIVQDPPGQPITYRVELDFDLP